MSSIQSDIEEEDENAALVIDNGSGMVKAGFAGDDLLLHVFLQLSHLALHILRGLHHFGHVAHRAQSFEHLLLLQRCFART